MSVIIRKGVPYGSGDTSLYSTAPVGTILAFASDTIPDTYLLCNGASLAITDYPELYKVIGTTFGSVDDDHFNVPKYNMGAYDLSDSKYWKDTGNGYNLSNGNLKIIINYNTSTIHVSINAPVITQDRNLGLQITIPETLGIADVKNIRCIWHQSTTNWSQTFSYNSSTHLLYITIDTNRGGNTKQTIYGEFVGDLVFDSNHLFTPIIKYKYTATSTNPLDKTNDDKDYLITTRAEWEAMTTADKAKFDGFLVAFIEDVNAGLIMDSEVVQGSENPVSGNAVYEAIQEVKDTVNQDWEEIEISRNFTANYPNRLKCFRKGKEVMINSDAIGFTQTFSAYGVIAYGFPKPSKTLYPDNVVNIVSFSYLDENGKAEIGALYLNGEGNLITRSKIDQNNSAINFSLIYYTD